MSPGTTGRHCQPKPGHVHRSAGLKEIIVSASLGQTDGDSLGVVHLHSNLQLQHGQVVTGQDVVQSLPPVPPGVDDDPLHPPPRPGHHLGPPGDPQVDPQVGRAQPGAGGGAASSLLTLGVGQSQELGGAGAEGVLVGPVTVSRGQDVVGGDQHSATVREHSTVCKY